MSYILFLLFIGIASILKMSDMEGVIFGIVDNGVLIIGAFFGLEVEDVLDKYIPRLLKGLDSNIKTLVSAVIAAGIANAVSDCMGGIGEANIGLAMGTFIGCLIVLLCIPILLKLRVKFMKGGE